MEYSGLHFPFPPFLGLPTIAAFPADPYYSRSSFLTVVSRDQKYLLHWLFLPSSTLLHKLVSVVTNNVMPSCVSTLLKTDNLSSHELWENLKNKNENSPILICSVSFLSKGALNQCYLSSTSFCKTLSSNVMLMTEP